MSAFSHSSIPGHSRSVVGYYKKSTSSTQVCKVHVITRAGQNFNPRVNLFSDMSGLVGSAQAVTTTKCRACAKLKIAPSRSPNCTAASPPPPKTSFAGYCKCTQHCSTCPTKTRKEIFCCWRDRQIWSPNGPGARAALI